MAKQEKSSVEKSENPKNKIIGLFLKWAKSSGWLYGIGFTLFISTPLLNSIYPFPFYLILFFIVSPLILIGTAFTIEFVGYVLPKIYLFLEIEDQVAKWLISGFLLTFFYFVFTVWGRINAENAINSVTRERPDIFSNALSLLTILFSIDNLLFLISVFFIAIPILLVVITAILFAIGMIPPISLINSYQKQLERLKPFRLIARCVGSVILGFFIFYVAIILSKNLLENLPIILIKSDYKSYSNCNNQGENEKIAFLGDNKISVGISQESSYKFESRNCNKTE